jgi:hypothetical protein
MWPILEALDEIGEGKLFWRTMDIWNACDATFDDQVRLLGPLLRNHATAPARRHDDKQPITVYRGAERGRIEGISWSRSRAVAERFAHGLRGDTGGERVIATARAPRGAVFMYINSCKEREVLLDPRQLLNRTITPFSAGTSKQGGHNPSRDLG